MYSMGSRDAAFSRQQISDRPQVEVATLALPSKDHNLKSVLIRLLFRAVFSCNQQPGYGKKIKTSFS
jgi:hypothetical protein